jgi:hypothetical protein
MGEVASMAVAVDSANTPYVAFHYSGTPYNATVMRTQGTPPTAFLTAVGPTAGFTPSATGSLVLAVNPATKVPFVVFTNLDNRGKASVLRFIDGKWVAAGVGSTTPGTAGALSMFIDTKLTPYVAYADGTQGNRLSVARFNP